jgi:hypothetical protein
MVLQIMRPTWAEHQLRLPSHEIRSAVGVTVALAEVESVTVNTNKLCSKFVIVNYEIRLIKIFKCLRNIIPVSGEPDIKLSVCLIN